MYVFAASVIVPVACKQLLFSISSYCVSEQVRAIGVGISQ